MRVLAAAMGVVAALSLASGAPVAAAPPSGRPLTLGTGRTSPPPPLSSHAVRSALKDARTAVQRGRLADALRQYEAVIAASDHASSARAEALYWAGMLRLSPDPSMHDVDRARAYLGELKVFHSASGRQDEAAVVLALSEEIGDLHRAADSLRAEGASSDAAAQSCRSEKEDVKGKLQAAMGENETLKESDSAQRAEILGLREELKRKDEALRKVKEVVVGWKAPR